MRAHNFPIVTPNSGALADQSGKTVRLWEQLSNTTQLLQSIVLNSVRIYFREREMRSDKLPRLRGIR